MQHLYLVKKHLITDTASLDTFREGIPHYAEMLDRIKSRNLPIDLGVKLSMPSKQLMQKNPEILKEGLALLQQFPPEVFHMYDAVCAGPGVSARMIAFNEAFSQPRGLVAHGCYDQNILHTEEGLNALVELCENMDAEHALLGVSLRDVPVRLGIYPHNSDLRIIHELVHSIAAGSEKLIVDKHPAGVTPAYQALGETTTGIVMLDFGHEKYPELVSGMLDARSKAPFTGFATDYYTTIKASQLAPVARAFTKYIENPFPLGRTEAQEFEGVKSLITNQTRDLGKSDIAQTLRYAVESEDTARNIGQFYPANDVSLVLDLMRQALDHR